MDLCVASSFLLIAPNVRVLPKSTTKNLMIQDVITDATNNHNSLLFSKSSSIVSEYVSEGQPQRKEYKRYTRTDGLAEMRKRL